MSSWLNKFIEQRKLKKEALEQLPNEELAAQGGVVPGANPGPEDAMQQDPNTSMPIDPSMMGMDPSMMEEPEPDVEGNLFLVDVNGIKVKMKLMPEIVTKPPSGQGGQPAPAGDPMADKSVNPNADPMALAQWITDPNTEKPVSNPDQGTVDPLSQEEEGISDTGDENGLGQGLGKQPGIKVHKKSKQAAMEPTPGADRSNPYYPCAVCANYDAEKGTCIQGLDVEKVQAAKSCSWLNSNFTPFEPDGPNANQPGGKDEEIYKNDVSQLPNSGSSSKAASFTIKDVWKKTNF